MLRGLFFCSKDRAKTRIAKKSTKKAAFFFGELKLSPTFGGMNNTNTPQMDNLAKALLADKNTADKAEFILMLLEDAVNAQSRLLEYKAIDMEYYQTAVKRETTRCAQRLETLAQYWGIEI